MAECLAAVGLASNVLQFVEVGVKVVKSAIILYRGSGSLSQSNQEQQDLTSEVTARLQDLKIRGTFQVSNDLEQLIQSCEKLADELMRVLREISINRDGNRRFEAIKKSFIAHRKRQEIQDLAGRLEKIRGRICDYLSLEIMESILQKETINIEFQQDTTDKLRQLASEITTLVNTRPWCSPAESTDGDERNFTSLATSTREFASRLEFQKKATRVLKSLHFSEIKRRQSDIDRAHEETFEWIFKENSTVNFVEWLQADSNNGLYWIAGNAGSGKSTLMKFILNHPSMTEQLYRWAGTDKVTMVSHFFWSAGTNVQKSQEGLFRTLLFQILRQRPQMIPELCPHRWSDNTFDHLESWTRSELFETMIGLRNLTNHTERVCIFIDGLDEYQGDHTALINILREISSSPYIKLCVSSRPWIEFLTAFGDHQWKLHVHELTKNDIRLYVSGEFNTVSIKRSSLDKVAWSKEELIEEICRKAQGVFLWVFLVVRSLLRGVSYGDSMRDLQRRLQEIPSELEKYFEMMLNTIEGVYRQRTARIFKNLIQINMPLPVLVFHFFDLEEEDPSYATTKDIVGYMPDTQIMRVQKRKCHQLIAQCKDLLRLSEQSIEPAMFRNHAGFLHRTVYDFLRTNTMSHILDTRAGIDFDPRVSLSRAYLAIIKAMPSWRMQRNNIQPKYVHQAICVVIFFANELETITGSGENEILIELQRIVTDVLPSGSAAWQNYYLTATIHCIEDVFARSGLHQYMRNIVPRRSLQRQAQILRQILRPNILIHAHEGFTQEMGTNIDIEQLRQVLELGISPNAQLDEIQTTVWSSFIIVVFQIPLLAQGLKMPRYLGWSDDEFRKIKSQDVLAACRLMLEFGAERKVWCEETEIDVMVLLRELFDCPEFVTS